MQTGFPGLKSFAGVLTACLLTNLFIFVQNSFKLKKYCDVTAEAGKLVWISLANENLPRQPWVSKLI